VRSRWWTTTPRSWAPSGRGSEPAERGVPVTGVSERSTITRHPRSRRLCRPAQSVSRPLGACHRPTSSGPEHASRQHRASDESPRLFLVIGRSTNEQPERSSGTSRSEHGGPHAGRPQRRGWAIEFADSTSDLPDPSGVPTPTFVAAQSESDATRAQTERRSAPLGETQIVSTKHGTQPETRTIVVVRSRSRSHGRTVPAARSCS
jgi:hypothetical protein